MTQKPTQAMVDELLAVRNELGQVAVALEEVLRTIPGCAPAAAPGLGEAHMERRFFPAIAALTRDLRLFTEHISQGVRALSDNL